MMKPYWLLLVGALAIVCSFAHVRAQEPGPHSDWERVEPERVPSERPGAARTEPEQVADACTKLGQSLAQLAAMRDQGFTKEMAMKRLEAAPSDDAAKDFAARNIAYVYAHPELNPAEIGKRIADRCAKMQHSAVVQ
jgi:hypothetical protein